MYMVSKKLKKKYNITDERAALYEAAETWTKALEGRDFLGTSFLSRILIGNSLSCSCFILVSANFALAL